MEIRMADDYTRRVDNKGNIKEVSFDSPIKALHTDPVRTVQFLVNICEKGMQSRALLWQRYSRKYRRGLRYVLQEGNKNPLYVTNYIYNVVETLKANLTSTLPAMVAQPMEQSDDKAADIFSQILQVAMKRGGDKESTETVVQHGAITGIGWFKPSFDPDAYDGRGELRIDAIAPEDVLILPTCLDYRTATLFIHRVRDLPEDMIKSTFEVRTILGAPETTLIENDRSYSDSSREIPGLKHYNVYEAWILDPETNKWWVCTIAGSTLLREPEENPYDHGKAPFVPWYDNMDIRADQAYDLGVGEVEEIEPLQDLADAIDMRIYKNIKQITGRQRVLNPASGINRNDIDDSPDRVYLCAGRPQDAMMWDNPPSLDQEAYLYRKQIEERIQIVSGMFDVTQGKKPSGIQAARAVSALQGAASKRIERKTESLIRAREAVGDLCAKIIKQYYTDTRIIRLASNKFVRIIGNYPPEFAETKGMSEEAVSELQVMRAQWKENMGIDMVVEDINFDYDIMASSDTALPDDKGERVQLLADLFRLAAIDRKALLDGLDFPDRNQILERLGENVTGKTPPEIMPENATAVQQQEQNRMAVEHQQQMQQNAQQGGIQEHLQRVQQNADMIRAARGAMQQMYPIPVGE